MCQFRSSTPNFHTNSSCYIKSFCAHMKVLSNTISYEIERDIMRGGYKSVRWWFDWMDLVVCRSQYVCQWCNRNYYNNITTGYITSLNTHQLSSCLATANINIHSMSLLSLTVSWKLRLSTFQLIARDLKLFVGFWPFNISL